MASAKDGLAMPGIVLFILKSARRAADLLVITEK